MCPPDVGHNSIALANEAIIHAIIQPPKMDDQTVVDIFAENNHHETQSLVAKFAEARKYESMVRLLGLVGEFTNIGPLFYAV